MELYIKNMVCERCRTAVMQVFDEQELAYESVELGLVRLESAALSNAERDRLQQALQTLGFEIIDSRRGQLIEGIKQAIIELVHRSEPDDRRLLSEYLQAQLHLDFGYLSTLFSAVEGMSIEQYFIRQRVERVKELLVYDESSLTEIAYQTGFSSPAHMSAQFKKLTGLTPGAFRKARDASARRGLDQL